MSRTTKRLYLGYLFALMLLTAWASPVKVSACTFMDCSTEKEDCGTCFTFIVWGEAVESECCENMCCTSCLTGICIHQWWDGPFCRECDFSVAQQCVCACGPHPNCEGVNH
jgi:hypothetical protein